MITMIKCTATILVIFFIRMTLEEGCKVSLFRVWEPVVFSSDSLEIIYPSLENAPGNRNLTISPGKSIILSCNGGRFENFTTRTISATCNRDFQFEHDDAILNVDTLNCINFNPVLAKTTSTRCGPKAFFIEIGFNVGLNINFLPQIVICFDVVDLNPLYANYNLTKAIGYIKSYLQTTYKMDPVYNVSVNFDQIYDFYYQQKYINKLLGLDENSTKYINPQSCSPNPGLTTPGFCFSKRPLTYRGNFVYLSQHYATYRYINVAPQWYFIDYNLNKLEYNVIDYVKAKGIDLEVYTGTYGVATLPHQRTGEAVELFLYVSDNSRAIPIPWIFWKLIYDRLSLKASVFLTVNDPYMTDISKNVICDDVSDEITWLTWEKNNVTKGYSYACSYQNIKNIISYLPDIEVRDLLI